jgi:DUF1680 family protein
VIDLPRRDLGPVAPTTPRWLAVRPLRHGGVRIEGGFWGRRQARNRDVTIPHGIRMLQESGGVENLRVAGGAPGEHTMPLFTDSDVYKVLEAIAWERSRGADDAQERFLVETTELLCRAQRPDGYLNSYVDGAESGNRFADPAMGHELYCAGHLVQAAVADLRTGGAPGGLPAVATAFADLIVRELPGELRDYVPGHPQVEMALTELARATGRTELLAAAAELIDRRGRGTLGWRSFGPTYFCDDVPFEQAHTIRGHAVRALYLLCGAADVHAETGRAELLRASLDQWDDMVSHKTYVTGGVGSRHKDEAFGEPFELPPDLAYCETCAAIASVMWNWRLLLITGEARFAELMERTLYNGVLAGLGLDGASFYYVNALHARAHAGREPWYRCACCPPNLMRLIASLDHYVATTTDDGVQIHQLVGGRLTADLPAAGRVELELETGYPYDGTLAVRVLEAPEAAAELAIRVPSWARSATAALGDAPLAAEPESGYVRIRRRWRRGDELALEIPLEPRTVRPDPRIDAIRSCVAFERGPLVYCFEAVDVPGLDDARVVPGAAPAERPGTDVAGEAVMALSAPGLVGAGDRARGWPYHEGAPAGDGELLERELRAIPYYARANRGDARMRVWIPA